MADNKNMTPEKEEKIRNLENKAGLNSEKTPEELMMQDKENDAVVRAILNPGKKQQVKPDELIKGRKKPNEETEEERLARQEHLRKQREEAKQAQSSGQKRTMGRNGRNAAPPPRDLEEIGSLADCVSDEERVLFIQHHMKEKIQQQHKEEDDKLGSYNDYFYSSWGELVLNDDLQGDKN